MSFQTQHVRSGLTVGVRRWLIKTNLMILVVAVLLFGLAGRLDWVNGWAYLALMVLVMGINAGVLIPRSPDLIAERSGAQPGSKRWDVFLSATVNVVGSFVLWIVAALDARYHWTDPLPAAIPVIAWIVALLGGLFVTWAMATNRFFSAVIRIQEERGHHVIDGGPYRWVRHPGYLGSLVYNLAAPLVFNSLWAYVPVIVVVVLIVVRLVLEDRTLQRELPGYADYARRVRSRLLPGVW